MQSCVVGEFDRVFFQPLRKAIKEEERRKALFSVQTEGAVIDLFKEF